MYLSSSKIKWKTIYKQGIENGEGKGMTDQKKSSFKTEYDTLFRPFYILVVGYMKASSNIHISW